LNKILVTVPVSDKKITYQNYHDNITEKIIIDLDCRNHRNHK
jgi:hypothetical protein